HALSLHDALPIYDSSAVSAECGRGGSSRTPPRSHATAGAALGFPPTSCRSAARRTPPARSYGRAGREYREAMRLGVARTHGGVEPGAVTRPASPRDPDDR